MMIKGGRGYLGLWVAVLCLLWVQEGVARAQATKARVLVVVQESVEGQRASSKGAEPALSAALLSAGYQVVERFESDGSASRLPLERILNDEVKGNEISAINADYLVVGRVGMSKEDLPYGLKGKAFDATMELRVLRTDSGRVVFSKVKSLKRAGNSSKVSKELAASVKTELVAALAKADSAGRVIELRIEGLTKASEAERLAKALAAKKSVSSATVRFVSGNLTIVDLGVKGGASAGLDKTLEALGLVVAGRSSSVINASYDALAASQRRIVVASFENKSRNSAHDWIESMGAEIFETEVGNSRYLTTVSASKRPASGKSAAIKGAKKAKGDLVVTASFRTVGPKLRFVAQIYDVKSGKMVATAQELGDDAEAVDVVTKLVWKLDQLLYKKLNPKGELKGYETKVRKYAPRAAVPDANGNLVVGGTAAALPRAQLVIGSATVDPIFPAQLAHYANRPFGEVLISNAGKKAAEGVRLGVIAKGLMDGEQLIQVDDIAPGAQIKVPLTAVFDRAKLVQTTQRRPVRFELRVQYLRDDKVAEDKVSASTVLHDRNAMNWQEGRAIAAFITYRDPVIEAYARKALSAASAVDKLQLPKALKNAIVLWDAVQESGIKYRRDPVAAFGAQAVDAVYFPRDTLRRGVGDCDDLSVLYASLVAASGVDARIVYTPGHVFVAVNSELSMAQAEALGGKGRVLDINGSAWLPIEVTKLKGGFLASWQAGIGEMARYSTQKDKISYVDFSSDWLSYPPFPLSTKSGVAPKLPASLDKRVAKDVESIVKRSFKATSGALPAVVDRQKVELNKAKRDGPWALLRDGTEAARRGDYTDAVYFFDAASKVKETEDPANNNLGNTYTLLEQYDQAIDYYQRALDHHYWSGHVATNLGFAQFQAGKTKEAKKTLKKAKTVEAKRLLRKLGLVKPKKPKKPKPGASAGTQEFEYGMRAGRVEASQVLIWIEKAR